MAERGLFGVFYPHWTGNEERLERPETGLAGDFTAIREELRTNLASVFLSKELNLPYELNYHEGFAASWASILKAEPNELFNAASDAQKIVDHIMAFEQKVEQKQTVEAAQEVAKSSEPEQAKFNANKLAEGEVIPHNGTEFKVLKALKSNTYQMQDLGTEQKFKMSTKDELFKQLLEVRNYSQERVTGMDEEFENDLSEEANNEFQMSR